MPKEKKINSQKPSASPKGRSASGRISAEPKAKLTWLPKKTFELQFSIPWDTVKKTYDETLKKVAQEAEIKGFELDLPEQANTMLDVANRNVERLLTLINDILDVSKLESGEIDFEIQHLKIKPFIDDTININQEYAKKHNTIFKCVHCHDDVQIDADRDRLVQVMSNLLSNAAKYSPADTPVEIFTEVDNGILRVNIKDYGPGIPKDFQSKLFKKFTQSNSGDTREVGGTGLGLSISKMIIEKLGGNIGFKTIEGKETTFYFELPIVKAS